MPIVAHSENKLIIDLFGKNSITLECDQYNVNNNRLAYVCKNKLKFINLLNLEEESKEHEIKRCENILISNDGSKVVLRIFSREISLYDNQEFLADIKNVDSVSLSNKYCGYLIGKSLYLYKFDIKSLCFQIEGNVKQICCFDEVFFYVTEENEKKRLYMVRNNNIECLLELKNIFGIKIEASEDQLYYLILIEVEYANNSYYPTCNLYYLTLNENSNDTDVLTDTIIFKNDVNKVTSDNKPSKNTNNKDVLSTKETSDNKPSKNTNNKGGISTKATGDNKTTKNTAGSNKRDNHTNEIIKNDNNDSNKENENEIVVIKKCKSLGLYYFKNLIKVLFFKFINDKFYVCFGAQPANLNLYSRNGKFIKKYPKMIRNRVFFSKDENRIINAGFGNLPGNIQIIVEEKTTCNFESLGASYIEWMNDDTHFMVATESYFKQDNKVVVYDYYGRQINEKKFKTLKKANVYGLPEMPTTVKHMEVANPVVDKYIPPHLKGNINFKLQNFQKNLKKKKESKSPIRTKAIVEKELEYCLSLKKKLANNEDLTIEDENKVFSVDKLYNELKKFEEEENEKS